MAVLIPQLTGTPGVPPTYNTSMADMFSWAPVRNDANRPLFARATYSVNRSNQLGQEGFDFIGQGVTSIQNYNAIQTIAPTLIGSITADNSFLGAGTTIYTHLTATQLPANFTLYGLIRGVTVTAGAIIGYK